MKRKIILSLLMTFNVMISGIALSSPAEALAGEEKVVASDKKTTKTTKAMEEIKTTEDKTTTSEEKNRDDSDKQKEKEVTTEDKKEDSRTTESKKEDDDTDDKNSGSGIYRDKYDVTEYSEVIDEDFYKRNKAESDKGAKRVTDGYLSMFEESYIYLKNKDSEEHLTLLPIKGTLKGEFSYGFRIWVNDPSELDSPEGKDLIDKALAAYDNLIKFDREKALEQVVEVTGDVSALKDTKAYKDKNVDMDINVFPRDEYYDLTVLIYDKKDVSYDEILASFEKEFGTISDAYFSDKYTIGKKKDYYLYTATSLTNTLAGIDERMYGIYIEDSKDLEEKTAKLIENIGDGPLFEKDKILEAAKKFVDDKEPSEVSGEKNRVEFGEFRGLSYVLVTVYYDGKLKDFQDINYIDRYR